MRVKMAQYLMEKIEIHVNPSAWKHAFKITSARVRAVKKKMSKVKNVKNVWIIIIYRMMNVSYV